MSDSDYSIESFQYVEGGSQLAELQNIIDRLQRGEDVIGAIRIFRKDGTVQDVAFGPSEADKTAAMEGILREFNNCRNEEKNGTT